MLAESTTRLGIALCNPTATCTIAGGCASCGIPSAVADLKPGNVVLNLDSIKGGAIVDVARRRVSPGGLIITPDMVGGMVEDLQLADATVDVAVANCEVNLANDTPKALSELARVTVPGGQLVLCDMVADDDATDEESYTMIQLTEMLFDAGWRSITFAIAHRTEEAHATSYVIRAVRA